MNKVDEMKEHTVCFTGHRQMIYLKYSVKRMRDGQF